MYQTTFKITKMDCPSEEQLIRMKLAGFQNIVQLDFDLLHRTLVVVHKDVYEPIYQSLMALNLGTNVLESVPCTESPLQNDNTTLERKLLWQVLAINLFFFGLEGITGWISHSMGLLGDGLDMLADVFVYGLALIAIGGTATRKKNIAKIAGYIQALLASLGFIEVIRRYFGTETIPNFETMLVVSVLALIGNGLCLYLLHKSKNTEVHIQASMIFTSNDIIVNFGVILASALVYWTDHKLPDLLIGAIVFVLVGKGASNILKLSK